MTRRSPRTYVEEDLMPPRMKKNGDEVPEPLPVLHVPEALGKVLPAKGFVVPMARFSILGGSSMEMPLCFTAATWATVFTWYRIASFGLWANSLSNSASLLDLVIPSTALVLALRLPVSSALKSLLIF
eukprot:CAMPEP_0175032926 /NCGR_PEP_ID=MMETSP0005-20121125/21706_1 /TAXON_ID=420556 /ORGANISM="Ochromonas sp., Strain CCMP1393" /LENGTH=127 /DNA_ID=CAMNT_0016293469 /DNA_START=896 /DNA_END=1279 /DNA_ORIENTATION=+